MPYSSVEEEPKDEAKQAALKAALQTATFQAPATADSQTMHEIGEPSLQVCAPVIEIGLMDKATDNEDNIEDGEQVN